MLFCYNIPQNNTSNTCPAVAPCLVAKSLITGSSNTTGSSAEILGRPGEPRGAYASKIIPEKASQK